MRTIGPRGLAMIKRWEALRSEAYQDQRGIWTIGWGHTGFVNAGMVITVAQAELFLLADMQRVYSALRDLPALTEGQYDALCSFTFNVGGAAFLESTLAAYCKEQRWFDAAREFARWHFAGQERVRGLLRRRLAEAALFCEDAW